MNLLKDKSFNFAIRIVKLYKYLNEEKKELIQKEANETLYWLKLLYMTDYISQNAYESINEDASELMKIITASIKTAKQSINH